MPRLKDYIVRTRLGNTDENQNIGDHAFDTKDYVFLESYEDILSLNCSKEYVYPSDYALVNGIFITGINEGPKNRGTTWYWLRSAHSKSSVLLNHSMDGADLKTVGLCPSIHLNISSIISEQKSSNNFKIEPFKNKEGKILYHTIEFGSYPQEKARDGANLEKLFNANKLTPTGKTYTGYMNKDGTFQQNQEFAYNGKKYIRVLLKRYDNLSKFQDGTKLPADNTPVWIEVQPIKWIIRNWNELPKEINPYGTGTAKTIFVRTEDAILSGIPFFPDCEDFEKTEHTMWQNSPLRAFLNGYNIHNEIVCGNGNKKYMAKQNFNFIDKGFLQEAFDKTLNQQQQTRKSMLEKLNPDKTPVSSRRKMTDTETIKSWIDAGQSVLLRGPSGIGKTERIKKLYPDLIYIKLTNNMFPEKVVGSMNLQTGQSIPPEFAKQALMACATDAERKLIQENVQNLYALADTIYERSKSAKGKVVIMLDELLNVRPAVQSLVYTLVLNKLVETGKGLKLPANTVVVATGNQKKYSTVAEDLAEPLEKRFDHILDMEPKVGEWIYEFAIPNKIHPAVIGYILSKYQENRHSENIYNMGYFYEEPEVGENQLDKNGCRGRTNDPRGWECISKMLYAFEEDLKNGKFIGKNVEALLKVSIGSKLREAWAEEFFDYYNHPTLTVEEVVNKKYTQADFPRDINEKFATMAGLLNATMEQVEVCREFIRKYCDPEYLSVYDIYWAGNDEQRMEKITELQELELPVLEQ